MNSPAELIERKHGGLTFRIPRAYMKVGLGSSGFALSRMQRYYCFFTSIEEQRWHQLFRKYLVCK